MSNIYADPLLTAGWSLRSMV